MFSKLRGPYKRYLYDDNVSMPDRTRYDYMTQIKKQKNNNNNNLANNQENLSSNSQFTGDTVTTMSIANQLHIITNTINFSNQDEDDEEDQIITIPPTTSTCDLSFEAEDGDDDDDNSFIDEDDSSTESDSDLSLNKLNKTAITKEELRLNHYINNNRIISNSLFNNQHCICHHKCHHICNKC